MRQSLRIILCSVLIYNSSHRHVSFKSLLQQSGYKGGKGGLSPNDSCTASSKIVKNFSARSSCSVSGSETKHASNGPLALCPWNHKRTGPPTALSYACSMTANGMFPPRNPLLCLRWINSWARFTKLSPLAAQKDTNWHGRFKGKLCHTMYAVCASIIHISSCKEIEEYSQHFFQWLRVVLTL